MIKNIIFPSVHRTPCVAKYGVSVSSFDNTQRANIVVIQSAKFCEAGPICLHYSDEGVNSILNRVLASDLHGVRVEFITFTIITEQHNKLRGWRLPIRLDFEDYQSRGNVCWDQIAPITNGDLLSSINKDGSITSFRRTDIVGGCANFYTVSEEGVAISHNEIKRLLGSVGYGHTTDIDEDYLGMPPGVHKPINELSWVRRFLINIIGKGNYNGASS